MPVCRSEQLLPFVPYHDTSRKERRHRHRVVEIYNVHWLAQ